MVTHEHICPFGLKAKDLLEREGFEVDDHPLRSREEADRFKEEHGVDTTPQVFIGRERVGGYDDLRAHLHKSPEGPQGSTYVPVISVFAVATASAAALAYRTQGTLLSVRFAEWAIALSMAVLATLKLRDLKSFSNRFITYDLLGMRVVRYAYVYPFAEAAVAVLMLAGMLPWLAAPVAIFIGTVGTASVFKAVYLDKRELKCACVGGESEVPLGFVSLTENIAMIAMGAWMIARAAL